MFFIIWIFKLQFLVNITKMLLKELSKKEKGFMDMDNSMVIAGGEGIRGLNSNGKNYNKD